MCHVSEFSTGHEYERHLITMHEYDYCKVCDLMGKTPAVRFHIGDRHKVGRGESATARSRSYGCFLK